MQKTTKNCELLKITKNILVILQKTTKNRKKTPKNSKKHKKTLKNCIYLKCFQMFLKHLRDANFPSAFVPGRPLVCKGYCISREYIHSKKILQKFQ